MGTYKIPILAALALFPLLAFLFTLPYLIYQYRKYGSIPVLRSLIVYSFVLYVTVLYFLVILPLPSIEEVAKMTSPTTQWIPFQFVADFIKHTSFVWNQPATYLKALTEPWFYQVVFNLVMFVPFGIYLRYYFQCSWKKTLLYSFLLSLFFEVTQLTGLYGIYPRGYRLFDVDDLMINTLGGMVGFFLTPLVSFFLPTRKDIDQESYRQGSKVTYTRRMTACLIDGVLCLFLCFFVLIGVSFLTSKYQVLITYELVAFFYFVFLAFWKGGSTLGKRLVKIKVVKEDGTAPSFWSLLVRYDILYGIIVPFPLLALTLYSSLSLSTFFLLFFLATVVLCCLFFLFYFGFAFVTKKKRLFYEAWSRTKNVSTISYVTDEERQE